MRHGFTLIELMIVIAIIAIIAAIAIPNLLESRITANESAAAASLKSGIFPAQVQFQAGGYSDNDSNGRGEYAIDHKFLAGSTASNPTIGQTKVAVSLLAPTFAVNDETVIGSYKYYLDISTTNQQAESFHVGYTYPSTTSDGRRAFGINAAGVVYATKQGYTTTGAWATIYGTDYTSATGNIFGADPKTINASNNSTSSTVYTK
jgi:prepilin-type N-terminal cleavage/methylation domain-containing protein